MIGERIRVTGIVQGVGFRPTVWQLANACNIKGEVWNDAEGVLIHAWGQASSLDEFVLRLQAEQPPLASIENIIRTMLDSAEKAPAEFRIVSSQIGQVHTSVAADAATCPACLSEVFDPENRRYRYPFTNCTHCGPRLSIIRAIPYDRENTSMHKFPMCPACLAEYEEPSNRRFHAQPNACGECGPQAWLEDSQGEKLKLVDSCDAIEMAARLIRDGQIVAIKGIGGIHLACDAGNEQAVSLLRKRKHRYQKALALMAKDIEMVLQFAKVDEKETALLQDKSAPIVVLEQSGDLLADSVAPGQNTIGFMLPYTPLHHLLMQHMTTPIVLTSGNRSDEPQTIDNQDAQKRLGAIADYYLLHDRDIINRLDDSVLRVINDQPRFLRRARGYAPQPIILHEAFANTMPVLALGGELKNTFCLLKEGKAIVSQHMGDLEDAETYRDFLHNLNLYQRLFDFKPECVSVDQHPNYLSTQYGRSLAGTEELPLEEVQHHHAHIASCLAEHGIPPDAAPVLGIVLDGLGFGEDGTLWGGEFLLADYQSFERLAHFQPIPMPGGVQAMREPWRNTWAYLSELFGWEEVNKRFSGLSIIQYLETKPLDNLQAMTTKGINSPRASSCGRLFDAVAAAIGICRESIAHEGQAAIELESLATTEFVNEAGHGYPYELSDDSIRILQWQRLWEGMFEDIRSGTKPAIIAARFHHSVIGAISESARALCSQQGVAIVVLSGGVFQNKLLLEGVTHQLRMKNLKVLAPVKVPANDGGIALGQATIASARLLYRASS